MLLDIVLPNIMCLFLVYLYRLSVYKLYQLCFICYSMSAYCKLTPGVNLKHSGTVSLPHSNLSYRKMKGIQFIYYTNMHFLLEGPWSAQGSCCLPVITSERFLVGQFLTHAGGHL